MGRIVLTLLQWLGLRKRPFNGLSVMFGRYTRTFSKNPEAEHLVGLRKVGVIAIDLPCEAGFHCPVCIYPQVVGGTLDERLFRSEYEGFLWCAVCNADYPSCLCLPDDPARAVGVYLATVGDALERFRSNLP